MGALGSTPAVRTGGVIAAVGVAAGVDGVAATGVAGVESELASGTTVSGLNGLTTGTAASGSSGLMPAGGRCTSALVSLPGTSVPAEELPGAVGVPEPLVAGAVSVLLSGGMTSTALVLAGVTPLVTAALGVFELAWVGAGVLAGAWVSVLDSGARATGVCGAALGEPVAVPDVFGPVLAEVVLAWLAWALLPTWGDLTWAELGCAGLVWLSTAWACAPASRPVFQVYQPPTRATSTSTVSKIRISGESLRGAFTTCLRWSARRERRAQGQRGPCRKPERLPQAGPPRDQRCRPSY